MNARAQFNPSYGFRQVIRSLGKDEAIPPLPSLLEQLIACGAEMARLAQEQAAAQQQLDEGEWEGEIEDAV